MEKSFYIETFGCQMNVHDSEKVRGTLLGRGYRETDSVEQAGLVLYNTCSIRDKAEQKVFARLAALRKRSGGKRVGVLGCVAQHNGESIFDDAPHVDLVCGSASYNELPRLLERLEDGESRITGLSLDVNETFDQPGARRTNPYSAYITIIEGCDKSCSYCVVPFTRGPERSLASASVVAEARSLVADGYSEIVLLGQTVNSYRDPSPTGWSFARLLGELARLDGVRRLRFTTSHPTDFTPEIVRAIDENPSLCDVVHLPVQSGSTRLLSRMRRTYSREEYLRCVDAIKKARREIELSTDIIVGFPGETERDFEETLSLLDEVEYSQVFSFKYSPRKGTAAIEFPDAVPEEVAGERLQVLQEQQRVIQQRRNSAWIGREAEALVEGFREKTLQWIGRTTQNRVLNFGDPRGLARGEDLRGAYCRVRVGAAGAYSLRGELTAREARPSFRGFRILQ